MKMIRNLSLATIALALVALIPAPVAHAASAWYCAPQGSNSSGSKRVVNPNTNNAYVLNGRGCGLFASADIGYFASLGYSQIGNYQAVILTGQLSAFTMTLPAGTFIDNVIAQETSGAAVSGGIKIGTTNGGTDVSSGITLTANGYVVAADVSLAKRAFSATAPQTLYIGAVTNWNSGPSVNLTILFGYF